MFFNWVPQYERCSTCNKPTKPKPTRDNPTCSKINYCIDFIVSGSLRQFNSEEEATHGPAVHGLEANDLKGGNARGRLEEREGEKQGLQASGINAKNPRQRAART